MALSVKRVLDLPDLPGILTGSHSPSWRCPLTHSSDVPLLRPEAFPCSTVLVSPRNNIILMYASLSDSVSTQIELPIT